MITEVKQYVKECDLCQRNKNRTELLTGKLMPDVVLDKPWTYITADYHCKTTIG